MADPFSIVSGAVGIIGLAASLTKSLHEFTTSVKTSSETLLQIRTNTDILSHMLTDLSPVLSDESVGAHEKEVIQMCVSNCKGNFERIEKIVRPFMTDAEREKDKPESAEIESTETEETGKIEGEVLDRGITAKSKMRDIGDTKGKFRMKIRRLGWPFREKETKELLDIIDRTIQHLGLALDTVHSYALLILSLAEHQKRAIQDTHVVVRSIESHTVEIESIVRSNSDTLRGIESYTRKSSDSLEVRLQRLEDEQRTREQETQQLLMQLLNKFEMSESPGNIRTSEVTHAVDPLARRIMQKTLNQDFALKNAYANAADIANEPPPAYSARDKIDLKTKQDNYTTTTNDWWWDTPFGRISIFATHHQRDRAKSGVVLSKDKSASRYKMMFTPAPWLYSKAAAFAFIKRVDGFGMHFTTPAVFKSDEPALKYLRRGEYDRLREALSVNGFLLNAVHEHSGRTLLAEAVRCRRRDACQYLLELGADPETEDYHGSTLFNLLFNLNVKHYQVNTCLKIFSLLLQTRADLFRGKATVMHSAVTAQYLNLEPQITEKILSTVYSSVSYLTSIDDPDATGNSPLVSACTYGHDNPVVIDFLLKNGAATNKLLGHYTPKVGGSIPMSVNGSYMAFYATARAGYIASMRRLIESGISGDPNIRTDYGRTILHNGIRRSVKYNTPRKSSNSKVSQFKQKHLAWKENFEYLIAQGADINAVDPNGWTALHCATLGPFCDEDMLKVLVDCGVDPDIKDVEGYTAWQLAIKYRRVRLNAWKWFGLEMFKRRKLTQEDLRGHVAKHLYMTGKWWKSEDSDEKDEAIPQDLPVQQLPDDDEWLFMNSMHPFESDQVFGEDKKLDPESADVKYRFPIDEFWYRRDVEGNSGGSTGKSRPPENGKTGTNWVGTVGNVLAAFVG
ncbi:Ankyrin-1 [Dactylellina cionopaga]|nr:Ankyrin-1 [Dactylellina cionopaga]